MFEMPFNTRFSLKCKFNTEIKVVHLCWDKQLIETSIINGICSLLSQLWTVLLWLVHIWHIIFIFLQELELNPTSQLHMHLWREFSVHDTWLINLLKSLFSIILSFPQPIFPIVEIIQFGMFLFYEAIKFGENNHQWNCKDIIEWLVSHNFPVDPKKHYNISFIGNAQEYPMMADNWSWDLPLPLSLLKNLSSASAGGREPSVGMQYLWQAKSFSVV